MQVEAAGKPEENDMSETVIRAENLDLTFKTNDGPVHALKGVSLDIGKGEFVSFIGPSGCGKTTFLRCIAALETPTGGSLSVNGMTRSRPANQGLTAMSFRPPGSIRGGPLRATSSCRWRSWGLTRPSRKSA